jgi:CRP-like cAMP-binding protein
MGPPLHLRDQKTAPVTGVEPATARGNLLLDRLGDADLTELLRDAREVELVLGSTLYVPGLPVPDVHFPLSGVVSLVTDLGEGEVVEAATVGPEGMSGIAVFLGAGVPTERARVQVAGRALTLRADAFARAAAAVDGPLYDTMRRYSQALFTQLARNAGCNRVHLVQQRAARWLLTTADRMHSPTFDITQEFLAQMLAVRRASVGRVARSLAQAGCITYVRGTLTILDRPQLEAYACTCYGVVREAHLQAAAPGAATR